ncbi:MAG: RNA-binding protein, partial [Porticoccaceae bacterium]|nr:RNA-binding protein [Porticoccaceae bacterium]
LLQVRQGWDEKVIEVIALSDQRRGAPQASTLYRETAASIAKREADAAQRKALRGGDGAPLKRPTKKQRRQIHGFWDKQDS